MGGGSGNERCASKSCKGVNVFFISILLAGALGVGVASMFTTWWMEIKVSNLNDPVIVNGRRDPLAMIYFSRDRGLFRECSNEKDVNMTCQTVAFNPTAPCANQSVGFWKITDLMKSQVGIHVGSLLMIGIALYCALFSLMFGPGMIKVACATSSIGLVGNIVAMVIFHIIMDKEKSEHIPELNLFFSWPQVLKKSTTQAFSWSYYMMWISTGAMLLSVVYAIIVSACWVDNNQDDGDDDEEDDVTDDEEPVYRSTGRKSDTPYVHSNHSYEDDLRRSRDLEKPRGPWGFDNYGRANTNASRYEDHSYPIRY
ncbi:uncharacterized protein LOC141904110 [Tubulanus polymorphus]|uniref:uncharacterized protein LOC141904110 n=1 Tax=Tubulanus polymorphus TaxID=672921 RepID=UPI003DA1EDD8